MNMDAIGSAILIIYDELKNDKPSKTIIKKLDTADSDAVIKDSLKKGIKRLRELDKNNIANDLESKLKGFI
jgi:hypothetical protein